MLKKVNFFSFFIGYKFMILIKARICIKILTKNNNIANLKLFFLDQNKFMSHWVDFKKNADDLII